MSFAVRGFLLIALAGLCLATVSAQQAASVTSLTITASDSTTLRQWDAWVTGEQRTGTLRIRERVEDLVLPGRDHERLEQYYGGIRIVGAGLTRQWRNGQVETVFGRVYEGLRLDVTPSLSAGDAIVRAGCDRPVGRPELTIAIVREVAVLTWRIRCYSSADVLELFINAGNGDLERRSTSLRRQAAVGEGRGVYLDRKKISARRQGSIFVADDVMRPPQLVTYDLRGNLHRAITLLVNEEAPRPSDIASDSDNFWEDGAIVDAHAYVGWTYDYLFKRFGRRGLDNRDTPILSIVHAVTQQGALDLNGEDFGTFAANAFWCSECGPGSRGMMLFGDGIPANYVILPEGQTVNFLSASIDITAHELAHGVTDFTSRLIYEGESGALNESFSDIIGTSVEFFFQSAGAGIGQADYKIGEDSFRAGEPGSIDGIRSMAVPSAYGDPDHYSARYRGREDDGGVHTNSAIANHAFYLAIEGGPHRISGITVPGVGAANRDQIEKVFYRAFVFFLPPNATFSLARAATVQAARELYGAGSAAERAILAAWDAVGVL